MLYCVQASDDGVVSGGFMGLRRTGVFVRKYMEFKNMWKIGKDTGT